MRFPPAVGREVAHVSKTSETTREGVFLNKNFQETNNTFHLKSLNCGKIILVV